MAPTRRHRGCRRRVYDEIIDAATRSIWASTYAFFDGPRAFKTLAEKMEALPDLKVTLLLNIERKRGNTTAADHLVRGFAERFWDRDWPGSSRPDVFYDPRSLEPKGPTGVLHAKAVVADEEVVFITSANFTEAALDRNIETGLLSRDRHLALTVVRHFQVLIDREMLLPLPMDWDWALPPNSRTMLTVTPIASASTADGTVTRTSGNGATQLSSP